KSEFQGPIAAVSDLVLKLDNSRVLLRISLEIKAARGAEILCLETIVKPLTPTIGYLPKIAHH
ncbi:MAG TPA: hypothetical protein VKA79_05660, partial [Aestuariivirgaceae bacterium]|nr:hypothetical protein [Aestuariivirgaceae bacterium]